MSVNGHWGKIGKRHTIKRGICERKCSKGEENRYGESSTGKKYIGQRVKQRQTDTW
jgi:hypothetical protein